MTNTVKAKNASRKFERISRWNSLEYTLVSRNNNYAQYADNFHSNDKKLNLTCFRLGTHHYPLNMFGKLSAPIALEDLGTISRVSPELGLFLELNSDKTKVRIYREVPLNV